MADDLADDFVSAAVGAFGAAFATGEGEGTVREEGLSELEVTLFAEAELEGRLEGTESLALALDEHGELVTDLVIGEDGEGSTRSDELLELGIEVEHRRVSRRRSERQGKGREDSQGADQKSNEIWRISVGNRRRIRVKNEMMWHGRCVNAARIKWTKPATLPRCTSRL